MGSTMMGAAAMVVVVVVVVVVQREHSICLNSSRRFQGSRHVVRAAPWILASWTFPGFGQIRVLDACYYWFPLPPLL
jgi:hypothetical protein